MIQRRILIALVVLFYVLRPVVIALALGAALLAWDLGPELLASTR